MRPLRTLRLAVAVPHAIATCLSAQEPEQVSGDVSCPACVISLDTVVSIGGLDGPRLHVISDLSHIAVDRRGRILVADPRQSEISVFDESGEFLRTVGRRGSGPGEYTSVSTMAVGARYIHVFEYDEGRTLLDHDFRVVRTDRFPGQILSAAVIGDDKAVFTANVPSPESVGHKLHILYPSGEMTSHGYDGGVFSSELTTWTSQRSTVTGRGDNVWAVNYDINRIVRWELLPEPRVGRVFERNVTEFADGLSGGYPRSSNLSTMVDDRGLWIIWHTPDPEWTERVPPEGVQTPAPPREVVDGWLDLVVGWSYFFGQSEGKAKVDSDWV